MPLIRGQHSFDDHYTQIPNSWVRDARLSFKARGLLALLMSHTPGWNMSIRSIAKANGTGLDTVKSAVNELEDLGYLVRSEEQQRNEKGSFADYVWTTTDPFQNPVTGKPVHGKQDTKKNILKENYLLKKETTQIFSADWKPDDEFANLMQLKYPQADVLVEAEKMVDYYLGTGKAKEVKDVKARFRTWMRNADKFSGGVLSKSPDSFGLPQIGPTL
jgi:hypothetical protein